MHAWRTNLLDRAWTLHQERIADGAPPVPSVRADVPGSVHTDLQAAGILPDPLPAHPADATREHGWVAACDWRYSTTFEITADHICHEFVKLEFEGLDTLATVLVNGAVVGRTANMHRRYRLDVTAHVVPGENTLDVVFASAVAHADRLRATEGEWPSASFDTPFNYVRKMACSWGSDWGPALASTGIWRPVTLHAWSTARLSDIRPHVHLDEADHGTIDVEVVAITGRRGADVRARCTLIDPDGATVTSDTVHLAPGTRCRLDAGKVRRWWPHTHGDQPLYDLRVELLRVDGSRCDERTVRIGFRTVLLDTTTDDRGSRFTLVVNGRALFARGAGWVPEDVCPGRVPPSTYRERLGQVVAANVDLLRVWGGGIYESDDFYDLCDELGILVWQDFAFTRAAYPEHLLATEVEAEAYCNVSRLMRHPSLAVWNGNNESIWGYWDWGWETILRGRSWGAGLFHDVIPRVCEEVDPLRPYWPGSPYSGGEHVAPNADAQGPVHLWDMWNQVDLVRFRDRTPRFVAAFGWQAPPAPATLGARITADLAGDLGRPRSTGPDLELTRGVRSRFGHLDDVDAFVYASHVVQARAVTTGVEHFRALRPWCMGTVWWHLNDLAAPAPTARGC